MAEEISTKISLKGEAEYRSALKGINQDIRVAKSSMQAMTSAYASNDKSVSALKAKQQGLTQVYEAQKAKVAAIAAELEKFRASGNASAEDINSLQIALNNATAEANRTSVQLDAVTESLEEVASAAEGVEDGAGAAADGLDETAESAKDAAENIEDIDSENIEEAAEGSGKLAEALGKVGGVALTGVVAALTALAAAAAAAVAELAKIAGETAAYADGINTLSIQTGVATDTLQEWTYAANLIDVSVDTMTGSMRKLTQNVGKAAGGSESAMEKFSALGVSIYDANGNLRDSEDIFFDAIDALGQIENETERDAVAMELFGRSAQELNPLVEAGAGRLRELGDEAREVGYVMSQEALDAANSYQDSLDRMDLAGQNLKNSIAMNVIPAFQPLVDTVTAAMNEIGYEMQNGINPAALKPIIEGLATDLQAALAKFGEVFGVIGDALLDLLPTVVDSVVDIGSKAIQALAKKLPQLIKQLMGELPGMLQNLGGALPSVVSCIIDSVGEIMSGVIETLPQWAPALGEALLNMAGAAIGSVTGLIKNMVVSLFSLIGVDLESTAASTIGESYANWLNGADLSETEGIDISLEPKVSTKPISDGDLSAVKKAGQQATASLVAAYTDGVYGNDSSAKFKFQYEIYSATQKAYAEIMDYAANAKAALQTQYENGQITYEAYQEGIAQVDAEADAMITDLNTARDEALTWANTYCGAATSVVLEHVGELEGAMEKVYAIEEKVNELTGILETTTTDLGLLKQKQVAGGKTTSTETMVQAFAYENLALTNALNDAAAEREAALEAAGVKYANDMDAYTAEEQRINYEFYAKQGAIMQGFNNDMAAMWQGMAAAFGIGPDILSMVDLSVAQEHVEGLMDGIIVAIGDASTAARGDFDTARQSIVDSFDALGLTDADYQAMAQALGLDVVDGNFRDAVLDEMASQASKGSPEAATEYITSMVSSMFTLDATQIAGMIPPGFQTMIAWALQNGMLDGIEGIEFNDDGTLKSITAEALQKIVTGGMGDADKSHIKTDPVQVTIPTEPKPEVDDGAAADAAEEAEGAAADAVASHTGKKTETHQAFPISVEPAVNVEAGTDTGLQDQVEEEVATQLADTKMDVNVAASVSMSVTVSDSNGAAVGEAVAKEITTGLTTGLTNADVSGSGLLGGVMAAIDAQKGSISDKGEQLGKWFGEGLAIGIGKKQSRITTAAKQAARKAYDAAYKELQYGSPSKMTIELGEWFSEGMAIGIDEASDKVVKAVEGLSAASLAPIQQPTKSVVGSYMANTMQPIADTGTTVNVSYAGPYTRNDANKFVSALTGGFMKTSLAKGG